MEGADVVTPSSSLSAYASGRPPDPLHIRKNTQKSKFLLSQAFKWKRIVFFVIPEMPSKTFVMVLKKRPDHFKRIILLLPMKEFILFLISFILPDETGGL